MNVSRRGFLSFLAAAPIIVRPGILMPVKPLENGRWRTRELFTGFDLGTDLMVAGQAWFIVGYDANGNMVSEQVPWREMQDGGWTSARSFRSITGIVT